MGLTKAIQGEIDVRLDSQRTEATTGIADARPDWIASSTTHINSLVIAVSALMALVTFFYNQRKDRKTELLEVRKEAEKLLSSDGSSAGQYRDMLRASKDRFEQRCMKIDREIKRGSGLVPAIIFLFLVLLTIISIKAIDNYLYQPGVDGYILPIASYPVRRIDILLGNLHVTVALWLVVLYVFIAWLVGYGRSYWVEKKLTDAASRYDLVKRLNLGL